MKTKRRMYLINFLVIFIIVSTVLAALAYMDIKSNLKTLKAREFGNVLIRKKTIENTLAPVIADLSVLVSNHHQQEFLDTGSEQSKKEIQAEFLLDSKIKTYYDQIRFINNEGMEVVRVNYNNGNPEIVAENQLQNKKDRYYFKETIALEKWEIYASPFDLNVERGKVESPVKPMIRIGMPVFDYMGIKKGIVIINFMGDLLLREFAQNEMLDNTVILSEGQFWLINSDGFWLKGPDPAKEWAFMYDNKKELSFSNEYSKEWKTILSTKNGQILGDAGLFTYSTIFPFSKNSGVYNKKSNTKNIDNYNWKVVSFIPNSVITENTMALLWKYIFIFIFINILALLGNFIIISARLKTEKAEKELLKIQESRNALRNFLLKIHQSDFPDLATGLKELVTKTRELLHVEYVSIWRMNKENTKITCMDIPVDSNIYPFANMIINLKNSPVYFKAIMSGDQIVADNAFEHSATKGFKESYLVPENVVSILDSPIWNHGKIMGIFALAQRNNKRKWSKEEQSFAQQIAASIAVLIETDKRIKAEQKMRDAVKKAEDANRTKSEFLANMSHEIRTPMNAILGFSELLLNKTQESEDREYLQSINSSGKTLLYLINDILDLSKIEANKVDIVNRPLKIKSLIDDTKQLFSQKTKEKKLDFIVEISPEVPDIILSDEVRLRQILLNVIGNAVKFTDSGFIKIFVEAFIFDDQKGKYTLTINVEDSGIGIPKESRVKVFYPFEQTGKGSLAKYGGTGLGLAITQRLLKLMNGSIDIVNKESPGTIFRITLFNIKKLTFYGSKQEHR